LYEQVVAQRMELEERDARIAEDARIVKLARSAAARQLAQKDAIIKDKDAEIARLTARLCSLSNWLLSWLQRLSLLEQLLERLPQELKVALPSRLQMKHSSAQQHQRPHYQQRFHQECSVKQLPMRQVNFELHFQEVYTMVFLEACLCKLFHQLQTASCMDCTLYHASTAYWCRKPFTAWPLRAANNLSGTRCTKNISRYLDHVVLAGEGSAAPSSRKRLKGGETADADTANSSRTALASDGTGAATNQETSFGQLALLALNLWCSMSVSTL
jgi:hypothetical protein